MDTPGTSLQIAWVYTDDLERSTRFYADVLGFRMIKDEGAARIFESIPGAAVGVCKAFDDRVVAPGGSMVSLVTDDVDGWYRRLVDAGAKTQGPPHRLEQFGIYTFFAEDPDGYVVEFQQFV